MDGTILDTLEDLTDSVNEMMRRKKYPEYTKEDIRTFVGNGMRKLMERALPKEATEEEIDQGFLDLRAYYQEHCKIKTKPYDGILELLQTLKEKGYLLAVVSNKADGSVKELCEEYFNGIFDCAIGEKPEIQRKPAPDSVLAALEELKVEGKDAVYIGDSEVDFQTSQNAKLDHILVRWGFRDEDFLRSQGGSVFVSKPEEILEII